ncbi:MAG TPA: DNA recombination protein RmuC [Treponemataceae bacterium]|nr:DNA recombination protein RmuC [Treponemataceae bacterium]
MEIIFYIGFVVFGAIQTVLLIVLLVKVSQGKGGQVVSRLDAFEKRLDKYESVLRDEFTRNRNESSRAAQLAREELTGTFTKFSSLIEQKFVGIQNAVIASGQQSRVELAKSLHTFEGKVDSMREAVEKKLQAIQVDNSEKLEKMRETVDEKLHKTLERRLGESFKLVSDRLELVQKGLGEMQTLAVGVGDLKKVLSNVKTKGVMGEYQLAAILEQLLTPAQYEQNVKTKKGSADNVEFAVKIPSKDDSARTLWLPVDAKFPTEDYSNLMSAYEVGDLPSIESCTKALKSRIEKFAKDISTKYIDPPNTTDFAIMFLPFEGLFAEVLRISGLFETVQREYKIVITGPTTISAFLSSLQMGFRSLAVEKRTSEIWEILGSVKTEFRKFGDVLEKTKNKIDSASRDLDSAGVRSRAIERQLRDVQELPSSTAEPLGLTGGSLIS